MSKYIVHSCPERMWYVINYLIPSMREQGIEDVSARCDYHRLGCLENCMRVFMTANGDSGAWHLQDDVIICRDFKNKTEELEKSGTIVCGFVWGKDKNLNNSGIVKPEDMWWSFPCIYIPDKFARECARWFYKKAKYQNKYKEWIRHKKYDDAFFKEFMVLNYPDEDVLNLKPSLVDHVDYLIGGSITNSIRKDKQTRAYWFEDRDLVDELAEKLRGNNNE